MLGSVELLIKVKQLKISFSNTPLRKTDLIASQFTKENRMSFSTAEVIGVIKEVTQIARNDPIQFKIYCPGMKKTFDAIYDSFCPMKKGDTIYALCKVDANSVLHVTKPPHVQQGLDKDTIVTGFLKVLRNGYIPAVKLYDKISQMAGGDDAVIAYVSDLSEDWSKTKNKKIMEMFGDMEHQTVIRLLEWWYKDRNLRGLYLFGLTRKEILSSRMTCKELFERCNDNPYCIPSISMEKCEDILSRLNKVSDQESKIRGLIVRNIWGNLTTNGWTATPLKMLSKRFPTLREHLEALKESYNITVDLDTAYLTFAQKTEIAVCDYICRKVNENKITYDTPLDTTVILESGDVLFRKSAVFKVETSEEGKVIEPSEEQKKAIQGALDHSICIITAGGGAGKTFCIKQIIRNLIQRGIDYAIATFTGKAISRVREVTGENQFSSTIHRLIRKSSTTSFEHLIIDEISMVTVELFHELIKAFPDIEKITLVGDTNQLQPIGWGSLFQELLKSNTVPTYKLSSNYRVYTVDGEINGIILNANAIIKHNPEYPFEFTHTNNFSILEGGQKVVSDIVSACFAHGIKAEQLVVLTPYNKDLPFLNKMFQDIYNPQGKPITDSRGMRWAVGDKVMLTENNYEINVFNGESGIIVEVDTTKIRVNFGSSGKHDFLLESINPPSKYKNDDDEESNKERTVEKLTLSYALTIDKSQGSEWAYVIFYISEFNSGSFLNRSRIYTALTRAKRCVWSVISDTELYPMSAVKPPPYRCENLGKRLSSKLPKILPFSLKPDVADLEMNNDIAYGYEPDLGYDCDDY